MKILTAEQIKQADLFTIENEPIKSIDLMGRAAISCFDWIKNKFTPKKVFAVFCGVGNNGGDGLVLARLLAEANYQVKVFVVEFSKNYSQDFKENLSRLNKNKVEITFLTEDNSRFILQPNIIVIDAIFGSGLNKPIQGFVVSIIHQINRNKIIAVDVPSGLFCEDNSENNYNNVVKAQFTLTFQQPKLSMMFPQNNVYCGELVVLPIGIHPRFLDEVESNYFFTTKHDVKRLVLPRLKNSHKGTFGHALLISGSYGKMGATVLCSKACLRTGVGLLTAHIPQCGLSVLQTAVPEAMCTTSDDATHITNLPEIEKFDAIGIGPGLGTDIQTQNILKLLIQNIKNPFVIDADALNILAENKTWLAFLPSLCILTPHPKEFERLVGKWINDEERLKLQTEFSIKNNLVVVLKGSNTSIALPNGKVYFNSSGNPGMATAGSGDVLTGIITSLLAQGYSSENAAVLGVYLHGVAGDIVAENLGQESLIASDIIEALPQAYGWLKI